jgi:hypothetical protein
MPAGLVHTRKFFGSAGVDITILFVFLSQVNLG